jgi:hypothetical protein
VRPILTAAANGGEACPSLAERSFTRPCFRPACPGQPSATVSVSYRFFQLDFADWNDNKTQQVIDAICAALDNTVNCSQISVTDVRAGSVIVEVDISSVPQGDPLTNVQAALNDFLVDFPAAFGPFSLAVNTERSAPRGDNDYAWGVAGVVLVSVVVAIVIIGGFVAMHKHSKSKRQGSVSIAKNKVVPEPNRNSIPQVAWSGGRAARPVATLPKTIPVRDDAALLAMSGQFSPQRRQNDNRLLDELSKDLGTWEPMSSEAVSPNAQAAVRRVSSTAVDFNGKGSTKNSSPQAPRTTATLPRPGETTTARPMPFPVEPRTLNKPTAQFPSDARLSPAFGGSTGGGSVSPIPPVQGSSTSERNAPFPPVYKPPANGARSLPPIDFSSSRTADPAQQGAFPKPPNPPAFSDPFAADGRNRRVNFPSMPPPVTGSPQMPRRPVRPNNAGAAQARFESMQIRGAPRTVSES